MMYAGVCTACVGVYMFACGYVRCPCMCVQMYGCMCVCLWVCMCLSVGIYDVCMCVHSMCGCMWVCLWVYMRYACVYAACVGVYVSVCECVWCPCMCVQDVWVHVCLSVHVYGVNRHVED